jgi:hypothetical protein
MAQSGHVKPEFQRPLAGVKQTWIVPAAMSVIDAVDGAHSTASMCQSVVALKRTTTTHSWIRCVAQSAPSTG